MSAPQSYTVRFHQHNRVVAESIVLAKDSDQLQRKAKEMADALTGISPENTRVEILDDAGATVLTSKYNAHHDRLLREVLGCERLADTPRRRPQHW